MIESVEDIFNDPWLLKDARYVSGYATPDELAHVREEVLAAGWVIDKLGQGKHAGQGEAWREWRRGKKTHRVIFWHTGGGHHGPHPYWKVSSGLVGIVRVGSQFEEPPE